MTALKNAGLPTEPRDGTRRLLIGTFGDPQEEGSIAVFSSREAAEELVKDDPFVLGGVVRAWHLREWNEILTSG